MTLGHAHSSYTKWFGTGQPRCVRYEFGEEKTTKGGVEYFHIKARYLDFDGKVFGEASRNPMRALAGSISILARLVKIRRRWPRATEWIRQR